MQSMAKGVNVNRPAKLTIMNTLAFIYKENGLKGLYRGVTPRIGLGIWQTICMVSFADYVKAWCANLQVVPGLVLNDVSQGKKIVGLCILGRELSSSYIFISYRPAATLHTTCYAYTHYFVLDPRFLNPASL